MMTHGEVFYARKLLFLGDDSVGVEEAAFDKIPHRMGREKALAYYKNKLRVAFKLVENPTPRDFLKSGDYFDFLEAKNLLQELTI